MLKAGFSNEWTIEHKLPEAGTGFISKAGEKNAFRLRMGVFPESKSGLATINTWSMVAKAMGIKQEMRVELLV